VSQRWELAYLGLGSNLGEREANITRAIERLSAHPDVRVRRLSSLYETEPVGYRDQPWFVNAVAEVETRLDPPALLALARRVESHLGRELGPRWGPRVIDVDILLFGGVELSSSELSIPHPRMWERLFVLAPLAELRPDLLAPGGVPIAQRIRELRADYGEVKLTG
jgi:2-amino-4-hydroxy-6-hydroxymethyldihydropteridine diphosphokinase